MRRIILGSRGTGILAETAQGLFIVDPYDFSVSRELLIRGVYDPGEIKVFRSVLGPDATLVVVGCHIGSILIPLCPEVRRAIGFEPDPCNFRLLELNLLLNRCSNAEIHRMAVGSAPQTATILRNPLNTGNTRVQVSGAAGETVEMTSLDTFPGLDSADLVIMDIEGGEPAAIRGARRLLSETPFLSAEYCPKQLEEIGESPESFVEEVAGLYSEMYTIRHGIKRFSRHSWTDYLLKRKNRPGMLLNLLFTNEQLEIHPENDTFRFPKGVE